MDISLTTPALLFPALSLLMLAYTNRFLGLSTVIRNLHADYQKAPDPNILGQIENLRYRVILIRNMQIVGAISIMGCVLSMLALFFGLIDMGKVIFIISLVLLVISLAISIRELQISVGALELHLSVLEDEGRRAE
ncbi:MAG TPA: DUF2721 domain-containing protein [Anaerolineae bacterium]|nr:DUF2721 domain-containing protein [Anaerolineae bacterium]